VAGVDLKITPTRANSFCATAAPCGGTGGLGRGAAWRIQSPGHLISDAEVSAAPSLCVCDCLVCKRPLSGSKSGSSIMLVLIFPMLQPRPPLATSPHALSLLGNDARGVCARTSHPHGVGYSAGRPHALVDSCLRWCRYLCNVYVLILPRPSPLSTPPPARCSQ
jgi:hypothetical protein